MDTERNGTRLLTYGDLADKLGYAQGTVENKVASGELPFTKIMLSPKTVRFRESEVEAWIEARASESESAQPQ